MYKFDEALHLYFCYFAYVHRSLPIKCFLSSILLLYRCYRAHWYPQDIAYFCLILYSYCNDTALLLLQFHVTVLMFFIYHIICRMTKSCIMLRLSRVKLLRIKLNSSISRYVQRIYRSVGKICDSLGLPRMTRVPDLVVPTFCRA